jgi:tetratricopeptide (TPR) repeat protein
MFRGTCLGLALALFGSAPVDEAGAGQPSLQELVRLYRSGERDQAATLASLWQEGVVEEETRRLADTLNGLTDAQESETLRLTGAVVVSEAALLHVLDGETRRARGELQEAVELVETEPPGPRQELFARRLSLLAALVLHSQAQFGPAHSLLRKALHRHPDDPKLITALGSLLETVAALRRYELRPSARERLKLEAGGGYRTEAGGVGSLPGASLSAAETDYQKALALDPALFEARLHLGRVRLLQDRAEEALPDLERVAAEAPRPAQRYLARLFEGRAREKVGDLDGAVAALRAAVAEAPGAQAGLLALGRALDRVGDTAGAQEVFARVGRAEAPFDPWLGYHYGQPERIGELVAELRELVP